MKDRMSWPLKKAGILYWEELMEETGLYWTYWTPSVKKTLQPSRLGRLQKNVQRNRKYTEIRRCFRRTRAL
ncbi:hypothetical protein NDU88_000536 [Pleurodeles waltl]|uniref:Uncharacterized protein n=1 Tax=Pleurodeles waltl TaxID=8319 RepID=A0AAV7P9Z4_PLEWA|nr:hypothetical protein NDU88_000536 [Pleurodeles waltl]